MALSSFSTTCLAFSQPASTDYITYRSGATRLFPETTFTVATTITYINEATIVARCLTLSPGETAPATVPFVGVSCSTTSRPGSTYTDTITSGETFRFLATTATRDLTFTETVAPTSYVTCHDLPDYRNPATCDTVTPLTWAGLVVTFITIQLTWWIFELPTLFRRDSTGGFVPFFDAVTWACLRANAPGSAGVIAFSKGSDVSEFARVYYLGMRGEDKPPELAAWKLVVSLASDLLSVVAAAITVYQACTLPEFDARRFGLSLWAYPALPTAVIGLALLAGYGLFPRTRDGSLWLLLVTALSVVLAGVIVALVLWRFNTTDDLWFMGVIFYGAMALPVTLFMPLLPIAILYGAFARVGGIGIAALSHHAGGQPYCKMPGVGFGVVYLVLGAISGLLGLAGAWYHYPREFSYRSEGAKFCGMKAPTRRGGVGMREEYIPKKGDPSWVERQPES